MSLMVILVANVTVLDTLSVKEATTPSSTSFSGFMSISRKLSILIVLMLQALHFYEPVTLSNTEKLCMDTSSVDQCGVNVTIYL